jgi:hypothetical protein
MVQRQRPKHKLPTQRNIFMDCSSNDWHHRKQSHCLFDNTLQIVHSVDIFQSDTSPLLAKHQIKFFSHIFLQQNKYSCERFYPN